MIDLFYEGGTLFMSFLTIILIALFASFWKFTEWNKKIGLYSVFEGIEQMAK